MNSFVVGQHAKTLLGGARYSATATLPVAKNQLVSDIHGQLSGGGGFADSYYLPLILGWNEDRASIRALPDFSRRRGDSPRAPATTSDRATGRRRCPRVRPCISPAANPSHLSAFELYEWHTTQRGTDTKPGDTINLDYSLMRTFAFARGPPRCRSASSGTCSARRPRRPDRRSPGAIAGAVRDQRARRGREPGVSESSLHVPASSSSRSSAIAPHTRGIRFRMAR